MAKARLPDGYFRSRKGIWNLPKIAEDESTSFEKYRAEGPKGSWFSSLYFNNKWHEHNKLYMDFSGVSKFLNHKLYLSLIWFTVILADNLVTSSVALPKITEIWSKRSRVPTLTSDILEIVCFNIWKHKIM